MYNYPSRSSKVVDFGTYRNRVWDFLLILNSNRGLVFYNIGYRPGEVVDIDEKGILLHVEFVTVEQQLNEVGV